jgi:spectinomycin phosphotransferase
MLAKPDIANEVLLACLRDRYGIQAGSVEFLPLGADPWSAAFRAGAPEGDLFLKLRLGRFDPVSVEVPAFLRNLGIAEVLAPLAALDGRLSEAIGDTTVIAYPFVEGQPASERNLTPAEWTAFGRALRRIHDASLPADLKARIPVETFSSRFRNRVRALLVEVRATDGDAVVRDLAVLITRQRERIARLVDRSERLAVKLASASLPRVLCHTDIHAANLLVADDGIHIVDWDQPLLAPGERDLMFVGAGIIGVWNRAEEAGWFYDGYGRVEVNSTALAYYRSERIIEDIAVVADQIVSRSGDDADRRQSLVWLADSFAADEVVEIAEATAEG